MNTLGHGTEATPAGIFTRSGKQVKRDGHHFADAVDEDAAEIIVQALNRKPTLRPRYGPDFIRG
jgi:hypothetical protein